MRQLLIALAVGLGFGMVVYSLDSLVPGIVTTMFGGGDAYLGIVILAIPVLNAFFGFVAGSLLGRISDRRFAICAICLAAPGPYFLFMRHVVPVLRGGYTSSGVCCIFLGTMALSVAFTALGFYRSPRIRFSKTVFQCRGCGYDLYRNKSGKCSECGRPIAAQQRQVLADHS